MTVHGTSDYSIVSINILLICITRRNAGVDSLDTAATRLVGDVKDRARDEMEGRTGETDSEMSGTD
jgi:hypothetical protein